MPRKIRSFFFASFLFFAEFSRIYADSVYEPGKELDHAENIIPHLIAFILFDIIFLVQLAARGLMLKKGTGNGWRILAPFYGRYLEYKNYWKTKYFWVNRGVGVYLFAAAIYISKSENDTVNIFLALLFLAALTVIAVNRVRLKMHTLDLFGFNKYLGLLEITGLGCIPDFLCGFSKRAIKKDINGTGPVPRDENESKAVLQEKIENWE